MHSHMGSFYSRHLQSLNHFNHHQSTNHSHSNNSSSHHHHPSSSESSNSINEHSSSRSQSEKKKNHIKKPLNAFMMFMKEMRPQVQAECTLKESAAINQILGRRVRHSVFCSIHAITFKPISFIGFSFRMKYTTFIYTILL